MNIVIESLVTVVLIFYYVVESWVLFCIPARMRSKEVKGQIVLITGSGSGLGRGMATRFSKLGCTLVLVDVNPTANEETAVLIRENGGRVHTYTCDVSKREETYRMCDKVKTEVGDVDILVNNAGIVTGKKFLDCSDAQLEQTMAVNIHAHFWTLKAFLPVMIERNFGHIVNIASTLGWFGIPGLVDYCTSKYAAVGLDESLRLELAAMGKTGVRTTVVCPYGIDTGMFDGCKTRFNRVLNYLNQDYVCDKIINAVLTNQEVLIVPRILYFIIGFKNLLPTKVLVILADFLGHSTMMSTFRGRAKQE